MKIRSDFVTNSSSSSFIVQQCDKFPDVFSVAEAMIPYRDWDYDDECIYRMKNSLLDRNTSVMFRSCNYETKIIKRDDKFYVETCNNHRWGLYDDAHAECRGEGGLDYMDTDFENEEYFFLDYDVAFKAEGNAVFVIPTEPLTPEQVFMIMNHDEMKECNKFREKSVFPSNRGWGSKPFRVTFSRDGKHIIMSGDRWENDFRLEAFLDETGIDYTWI